MPFTKFTNLDFDQIKDSIKDYLRANSDFSGFDFDGSNFSVLIDTLAYNTYITAFNSNMIVNESFLDSATVRENVVSLARNIGYVPKSRNSAKATVTFTVDVQDTETPTLTLKKGLVCIGQTNDSSYLFSIVDDIYCKSVLDPAMSFHAPLISYDIIWNQSTYFDNSRTLYPWESLSELVGIAIVNNHGCKSVDE